MKKPTSKERKIKVCKPLIPFVQGLNHAAQGVVHLNLGRAAWGDSGAAVDEAIASQIAAKLASFKGFAPSEFEAQEEESFEMRVHPATDAIARDLNNICRVMQQQKYTPELIAETLNKRLREYTLCSSAA